jgi:hypothetical protein
MLLELSPFTQIDFLLALQATALWKPLSLSWPCRWRWQLQSWRLPVTNTDNARTQGYLGGEHPRRQAAAVCVCERERTRKGENSNGTRGERIWWAYAGRNVFVFWTRVCSQPNCSAAAGRYNILIPAATAFTTHTHTHKAPSPADADDDEGVFTLSKTTPSHVSLHSRLIFVLCLAALIGCLSLVQVIWDGFLIRQNILQSFCKELSKHGMLFHSQLYDQLCH